MASFTRGSRHSEPALGPRSPGSEVGVGRWGCKCGRAPKPVSLNQSLWTGICFDEEGTGCQGSCPAEPASANGEHEGVRLHVGPESLGCSGL